MANQVARGKLYRESLFKNNISGSLTKSQSCLKRVGRHGYWPTRSPRKALQSPPIHKCSSHFIFKSQSRLNVLLDLTNEVAKHSCLEPVFRNYGSWNGTPTERQFSKRQVSKRPVSKRLKRQFYKTSGRQNVRSSKRPFAKKHPNIFCTCGWWKSAGLKPDILKPDDFKPDILLT
jgi:hypothetical protein